MQLQGYVFHYEGKRIGDFQDVYLKYIDSVLVTGKAW